MKASPCIRPIQISLVYTHPRLPVWERLPDRCREELVRILAQMLKEHAQVLVDVTANEQDDE
jgi:hypothetical protein